MAGSGTSPQTSYSMPLTAEIVKAMIIEQYIITNQAHKRGNIGHLCMTIKNKIWQNTQ